MNDEQELKKALTDWVTSYKDIAERNALAETPDESAGNLIRLLKAMGWKSPEEVKEAIQDEIDSLVESGML